MSFEMKVKLTIKKVVEELSEEKYENLKKNGFMGDLTIDDINEIKQFCGGNLPSISSENVENIRISKNGNNKFWAFFSWYSDSSRIISICFDGINYGSDSFKISIRFISKRQIRLEKISTNYYIENIQIYPEIIQILECFIGENEKILFKFPQWDRKKYKDDCYKYKEDDLEAYRRRILYKQDSIEDNIKSVLIDSFIKHRKSCMDINIIELKETLFNNFMNEDLNDLEDDVEDRVWDVIFDFHYKYNLDSCGSKDQEFIKDRVAFISRNDPTNQHEIHDSIKDFLWYSVDNKEEIRTALEIDSWFSCIVIGDGKQFLDYSYALSYYENHADHIDGMVLSIREGRNANFEKNEIPKLKNIIQFIECKRDDIHQLYPR